MTGARLKEVRSQLGLTQDQLAALVGGRKQLFSDYEHDRRPIPAKLALVMECFCEIDQLGGNIETVASRARKSNDASHHHPDHQGTAVKAKERR